MGHFVAIKPQRMGDVVRQPGEEIPEAEAWPPSTREQYIRAQEIDYVPDEDENYKGPRAAVYGSQYGPQIPRAEFDPVAMGTYPKEQASPPVHIPEDTPPPSSKDEDPEDDEDTPDDEPDTDPSDEDDDGDEFTDEDAREWAEREVDSYATGGGWYTIEGEKYQGKPQAIEALVKFLTEE